MSDNISTEAAVAGEAAAAAVEEVQAREAVIDTSLTALAGSEAAMNAADNASETAETALTVAVVAGTQADQAADMALVAQQNSEAVAYATQEAFQAFQNQYQTDMDDMRRFVSEHVSMQRTEPQVEEIEANVGTGGVSDSGESARQGGEGGDSEGEAHPPGTPQKQRKSGLRHRR